MKELIRYKSFCNLVIFLMAFFICLLVYFTNSELIVFPIFGGILLVIVFILFLDEYEKAKRVVKNGTFVLGVLEPQTIKLRHLGKGLYMLKASVKYYDTQRKMTLKFNGYDIFDNWEMRVGKVKRVRDEDKKLEVLVGYLPEEPKICELYLKDAFEKI